MTFLCFYNSVLDSREKPQTQLWVFKNIILFTNTLHVSAWKDHHQALHKTKHKRKDNRVLLHINVEVTSLVCAVKSVISKTPQFLSPKAGRSTIGNQVKLRYAGHRWNLILQLHVPTSYWAVSFSRGNEENRSWSLSCSEVQRLTFDNREKFGLARGAQNGIAHSAEWLGYDLYDRGIGVRLLAETKVHTVEYILGVRETKCWELPLMFRHFVINFDKSGWDKVAGHSARSVLLFRRLPSAQSGYLPLRDNDSACTLWNARLFYLITKGTSWF